MYQTLVPTVWNERYHSLASRELLSTRKAKTVVERADWYRLVELRDPAFHREATIADIERVHTTRYTKAVLTGKPRPLAESQGFRWSPAFADSLLRIWSGQQAACRMALRDGLILHPVSGAHHAGAARGGGFCTFNFLVGAGKRLLDEGTLTRVAIIDLDAHFGDGTFELVKEDEGFWLFDISGGGTLLGGRHYLAGARNRQEYFHCLSVLPGWLDLMRPELVMYQAGMDPYENDPIGGIAGMDEKALKERDFSVIYQLMKRHIPTVVNFAGGYVEGVTENLHLNTIKVMAMMPSELAMEARCLADLKAGRDTGGLQF